MYKYRLTRRGKVALTLLIVVLFSATSMLSKGIMAKAQNNRPYTSSSPNMNFKIQSLSDEGLYKQKPEIYTEKNANTENTDAESSYKPDNNTDLNSAFLCMNSSGHNIISIDAERAFVYEGKKVAFLTFDDGPSKNITPQILSILKKYNVKATFFVVGSMAEKNSAILKDIADSGHAIGIHTYSHNYKTIYKSKGNFISEIKMTEAVLKKTLGEDFHTRLFRFPGGSFESYKKQYKEILASNGYVNVDWNVINGDGESSNLPPQKLLDRVKATSRGKRNIIILMHNSSSKQTTADALPSTIEYSP